jgi:hypothetical protein
MAEIGGEGRILSGEQRVANSVSHLHGPESSPADRRDPRARGLVLPLRQSATLGDRPRWLGSPQLGAQVLYGAIVVVYDFARVHVIEAQVSVGEDLREAFFGEECIAIRQCGLGVAKVV